MAQEAPDHSNSEVIVRQPKLLLVGYMHPLDFGRGGMCLPEPESDEMVPVYRLDQAPSEDPVAVKQAA